MNHWKIILATLVIFSAGFIAGTVFGSRTLSASGNGGSDDMPFRPWEIRAEYIQSLVRELDLTDEQRQSISTTVEASQERIRILFDLISPEMREELQHVRDTIRATLTPDQQSKFDELRKKRRHRGRGHRKPPPDGERK